MTTIFFYVLLFQIKDWDKICEEEGKMTSPIICYILLGVILFIILMRILSILQFLRLKRKVKKRISPKHDKQSSPRQQAGRNYRGRSWGVKTS